MLVRSLQAKEDLNGSLNPIDGSSTSLYVPQRKLDAMMKRYKNKIQNQSVRIKRLEIQNRILKQKIEILLSQQLGSYSEYDFLQYYY